MAWEKKTIVQMADLLKYGMNFSNITNLKGTVYSTKDISNLKNFIKVPSFEDCLKNKKTYAESFKLEYYEQDPIRGKILIQKHGDKYIVQNPPQDPLTQEEMDIVYSLPYTRTYHPIYEKKVVFLLSKKLNFL